MAGCSSQARIERAGAELGIAAAGVFLPAWPPHCREEVPHALVQLGFDPVVVLRMERLQLDFANRRAANCAAHYDRLAAGLEAR